MSESPRAQRAFDRMKQSFVAAGLIMTACVAHAQPASSPPSARDQHAAQCVAALDVNTQALAQQVKAGKEEMRPVLQSRLESGVAFVGDTYLHGERDETRARALANQALEDQKSLSPAQLTARQTACADEGAALLAASNGLERLVVTRVAKKRMAKLLGG